MKLTTLSLHSQFPIAPVDLRIFGGFLEHMGRAVYEGVYDPLCQQADADGCRMDVLQALRKLNLTVMRYPGGNFASGYHWLDGVGPRSLRPTLREMAWHSVESNQFGTDEYIGLCKKMDWTPMLTVNLGTGTPEEARHWVEYCNSPTGTRYSNLRQSNGHDQPHAVKLWCLGNEMDGPWQIGHVPADQYAIRAQQAAKLMKDTDPSIELVACGSCGTGMASYMDWDRQVLEYLGDAADYISAHRYVGNNANDTPDYLAITSSIDRQIEEMDAVCQFVQAKRRSSKRTYLCFDEWNVWYKNHETHGKNKIAPHLLEEVYNLEDALVVAGFLHSFIRHADFVKIANLAQIVNVIAPLLTRGNELLIQSIFHPFEMFAKRRNGIALRQAVNGPAYEGATNGRVPYIDSSAILDGNRLQVFLTNRSLDESADVAIAPADFSLSSVESAELLTGPNAQAANSFENPNAITPIAFEDLTLKAGQACGKLPPLSFVAMTFNLK